MGNGHIFCVLWFSWCSDQSANSLYTYTNLLLLENHISLKESYLIYKLRYIFWYFIYHKYIAKFNLNIQKMFHHICRKFHHKQLTVHYIQTFILGTVKKNKNALTFSSIPNLSKQEKIVNMLVNKRGCFVMQYLLLVFILLLYYTLSIYTYMGFR